MAKKSAIAVAGLLLAVAALVPASASAKHEGQVQHVKGRTSGLACNTAGSFTVNSTGRGTMLGRFTRTASGSGTLNGTTFEGSGTFTVVAANGDMLTGTFTSSSSEGTATVEATITGGTGRFEGVTGEVTETLHETTISEEGETICGTAVGRFSGTITF
jgi:hypothetical protein